MAELVIKISGDIKNYEDALAKAESETEGLSSTMEGVATKSAIAFAALTAELTLALHAYEENEQATLRLTGALQNNGLASDDLLNKYKDQAESIQKLTGVNDDLVLSGLAVLQNLVGQREITPQLTKAVVDFAARTGQDLNTAFETVGRAVQGHTRGLQQYGVVIDLTRDSSGRLADITQKLTEQFGGAAEEAVQGLGVFKLVAANFDDLQKQIGKELAPAVSAVGAAFADFLGYLASHHEIVDFITAVTVAGTVVSGLIATVTAAGVAFLTFRATMAALQVQTSIMTLSIRALVGATGLGLLLIVIVEVYEHWNQIWPAMQQVFKAFVDNVSNLLGGLGKLLSGVITIDPTQIKEGLAQITDTLKKGYAEATAALPPIQPKILQQDPNKKAAADKRLATQKANDAALIAQVRATREVMKLEAEQGSSDLIALKKQEIQLLSQFQSTQDASERGLLMKKIAETRQLEQQAAQDSIAQESTLHKELLDSDVGFQNLSAAQQQAFLLKNKQSLAGSILSQNQAEQQVVSDRLKIRIKADNDYLTNQIKFGSAYATIYKAMHTEEVEGASNAASELAQVQNSSNDTLKSIGKAAAVANIGIKTAESAMNIFAGFSTIPIVGYALGIAGAAAAIAYGAEQESNVLAMAEGGLLSGGTPGVDSIPVLAQQGELIAPKQNFDEVVNAVADKRAGVIQQQSSGITDIVLSLKGELVKFVEVEMIKRQRQGISNITTALT